MATGTGADYSTISSAHPGERGAHLIGRESELVRLRQLIDHHRLVTITGAPGMGKTSLALALLRSLDDPDLLFCDLTEAGTIDDICRAVAARAGTALLARDRAGDATGQVAALLGARRPRLVVLDNFEQIAQHAAATIGQWSAHSAETCFLVTSRQRLGLDGEVLFELGPLALPERGRPVRDSAAVALFLARAAYVRPSATLTGDDEAAVAELVAALDGNPLAIELAAARLAVLAPRQIVEHLRERFQLLRDRLRLDIDPRHATLEAALDWSWNLLTGWERDALTQLSVFRGGFGLEAAAAVLDCSAHPDAPWAVDVLQALRDRSLLQASAGASPDEVRYTLLASVREYAAARGDARARELAAARHLRYFAARAPEWSAQFDATASVVAEARLGIELDNITIARQRALATESLTAAAAAAALELSLAVDPVFAVRGPLHLRQQRLDEALTAARAAGAQPALLARGLEARAEAQRALGATDEALADFAAAEREARTAGQRALAARARLGVGLTRFVRGDFPPARRAMEEALQELRAAGDRLWEGRALSWLGRLHIDLVDLDAAWFLLEQAMIIHRELGDRRYEALTSGTRAIVSHERNQLDDAEQMYRHAQAMHRSAADGRYQGVMLANLAILAQERRDYARAQELFDDGLAVVRASSDQRAERLMLGYYARLEQERGPHAFLREYLEWALQTARSAGDEARTSLMSSWLGSLEADLGNVAAARRHLEVAKDLARGKNRRYWAVACICHAHVAVARARDLAATERDRAQRMCHEARTRALGEAYGDGPPLTECSSDVRLALAILDRRIEEALRPVPAPPAVATAQRLAVDRTGRWFRLGDARPVNLRRRRALRLLLAALAHNHAAGQRPLSMEALWAAGWPGEQIHADAAANRVYTALWTLRKLGLKDVIERCDEGYALSRSLSVEIVDGDP